MMVPEKCKVVVIRHWWPAVLVGCLCGVSLWMVGEGSRNLELANRQQLIGQSIVSTMSPRIVVDAETMLLVEANLTALELLGVTSEVDIQGVPVEALIPGEFIVPHREGVANSEWRLGEIYSIERPIRDLCGGEFPAIITLTAIEAQGRPYYVAKIKKLSERIEKQAKLTQEVYQRVVDEFDLEK